MVVDRSVKLKGAVIAHGPHDSRRGAGSDTHQQRCHAVFCYAALLHPVTSTV